MRKELEKIKTLSALKNEYRKVWYIPDCDKNKMITVHLVSPTCVALGDSRVRTWIATNELPQENLMNNAKEDDVDDLDTVDKES